MLTSKLPAPDTLSHFSHLLSSSLPVCRQLYSLSLSYQPLTPSVMVTPPSLSLLNSMLLCYEGTWKQERLLDAGESYFERFPGNESDHEEDEEARRGCCGSCEEIRGARSNSIHEQTSRRISESFARTVG